jgi:hypothetical protein
LFLILMSNEYVYGDWNDLKMEWSMIKGAIKESPSLAKKTRSFIKRAWEGARLEAELHCRGRWPKVCPWPTLSVLGRAVGIRDRQYRALEQAGDPDFGSGRRSVPVERVRVTGRPRR